MQKVQLSIKVRRELNECSSFLVRRNAMYYFILRSTIATLSYLAQVTVKPSPPSRTVAIQVLAAHVSEPPCPIARDKRLIQPLSIEFHFTCLIPAM